MRANYGRSSRHASDDKANIHLDNGHEPEGDDVPGAIQEVEFLDAEPEGEEGDCAGAVGGY